MPCLGRICSDRNNRLQLECCDSLLKPSTGRLLGLRAGDSRRHGAFARLALAYLTFVLSRPSVSRGSSGIIILVIK
jgi:hypothetical protein